MFSYTYLFQHLNEFPIHSFFFSLFYQIIGIFSFFWLMCKSSLFTEDICLQLNINTSCTREFVSICFKNNLLNPFCKYFFNSIYMKVFTYF